MDYHCHKPKGVTYKTLLRPQSGFGRGWVKIHLITNYNGHSLNEGQKSYQV